MENAGYVTASGLSGYNFATQGYVQTAVTDLATESYVDTAVTDLATESYVDTAVTDLATESYVDTAVAGVSGSGGVLNSSGHLDLTSGYQQDTTNKSSMIMFNGGSSSSNKDTIYFDDSTNRYHFTADTTKYASGNAGIVCGEVKCNTVHFGESAGAIAKIVGSTEIDIHSDNKVRFIETDANAERITFDLNNGFLGIQNTAPGKHLVVGTGATNDAQFTVDVSTAKHMIVGNEFGSGHYLDLVSMGSININLDSNNNDTDKVIDFRKDTRTNQGTVLMRIRENGNVGIGTTSPAQKLDVAGRIRADTMEIDSYIYHVGDTNTYFGFSGNDHFQIVEGGGTRLMVDSTGDIGVGRTAPKKKLDVAGTVGCAELFYGDTYTGYEQSYLTCTKSRRSTGDPSISFTINAATQVGWIPYTFQLYGSGVNSNGGSHFQRIGEGHGRYYNGSNSTSGVSGVTFTASQSGSRGTLTWRMDDVGRNYTISRTHTSLL